jgi:crotonobetainyl-CoA:carnitine CoA-transferase CaiB-like acyl-CoA transferase
MNHPFLDGIKVVDLTRALSGPFCTMMLGDFGAEVIKVEPPGGDETRLWGPPFVGGESAYFLSINRNKKSIVLDLRKNEGVEIVKRLARDSDILVENYRPGTAKRLGVDYDSLKKVNSKLIYCSISGFGQTGPDKDKPGYDIITFAASGMMSITGEEGRPPVKAGVPVSDIGAGMYAAYAIVSALFRRSRDQSGEYIDASMLEGQISWLTHQAAAYFATGENPNRLGSSHASIVPYQAFKARDDYFVLAVGNDELWAKFCTTLSRPELKEDPRFASNPARVKNKRELESLLESIFANDTAEGWVRKISSAGVPCCQINKLNQVFSDPQVLSRRMVTEVEHQKAGKIKQLGIPYRFANYDFEISRPPPLMGEHSEEILASLDYSKEKVAELKRQGIIR